MGNDGRKELEIVEVTHFVRRILRKYLPHQEASQTGANPGGLTIRLLGLARVWMAAISSSRSSKSTTTRFSAMRSGLVVRDNATTSSCWISHRRTTCGIDRPWLSAISAIVGSVSTRPTAIAQ